MLLGKPITLVEEAASGFTRQRWVFALTGSRLVLERYHYERRFSKHTDFKVTKLYDRTREPGEDYGDWIWLDEADVPWDDEIVADALAELTKQITVGRQSDFSK